MTSGGIRNDVCAQPRPEQVYCVVTGPPRGKIFKQQFDDWFDGDGVHDMVVVAEPLVNQAGQPPKACTVIRPQSGPRIPKQLFRVGEGEQGFSGHIAPPSTMT